MIVLNAEIIGDHSTINLQAEVNTLVSLATRLDCTIKVGYHGTYVYVTKNSTLASVRADWLAQRG